MDSVDVLIVGAGPCGLAAAIACGRAGLRAVVFDRGPLVSGIVSYPAYMTFFSTAERIAIGGVPFVVAADKPTRRDALAYYRMVTTHCGLDVRQYEGVEWIEPLHATPGDGAASNGAGGGERPARFRVRTRSWHGVERDVLAHAVVVATGYFGTPSKLGVPGEELPHVTHYFREGHEAFQRRAIVVGGGNSAVDAALELYRAGARVTMVHFGPQLDPNIKPWVLPDISARLREGTIGARWQSRVLRIEPDAVILRSASPDESDVVREERLPADHVYLMTGFLPNSRLLEQLGVPLHPVDGIPAHDPATMETSVPGVFIAGVIASGFHANRIFIENGRDHGTQIAAALERQAATRRQGGVEASGARRAS
ncbi:MAG TPA: YpdA family putative bacillithiol disulfide reductase [Gemmatirosa sp.]|nr:YpdA family putative bacillithiol disulfide reductase [Gemmatirosa sp.]